MVTKEIDINIDEFVVFKHNDDSEKLFAITIEEHTRIKNLSRIFDFNYQSVPDCNLSEVRPLIEVSKNKYQLTKESLIQYLEVNKLVDIAIWERNSHL